MILSRRRLCKILASFWLSAFAGCALTADVSVDAEFLSDFVAATNTTPSEAKTSVGSPSSPVARSSTTISFPVYLSNATYIDITSSHVVLLKTGTVNCSSALSGSGTAWTVTVHSCSGDGTLSVQIAGKAARDADGRYSTSSSPSQTVAIDNTPPTVTLSSPSGYVNLSNHSAALVGGTCSENGRLVNVSVTDSILTLTGSATCTLNAWSVTMNMSSMSSGSITISATATDLIGHSGNIVSVIAKDIVAPNAASSLGWSASSPTASTALTANWTKSSSSDLLTQKVQFYSDGSCTSAFGSLLDAGSASSQNVTGSAGSTYSYKVTTIDSAGNTAASPCSSSISIVDVSLANSTLSLSSSSIQKSQTSTVTLTIKNASSVQASSGGLAVSFSVISGTSNGTFSSTTDNGNGTYTSTFTGTVAGTAAAIRAAVSGIGNVTQTQSITVLNSAPVLTLLSQKVFPVDGGNPPLVQGASYTLASVTDANSDAITFTCTYQSLSLNSSDPNYAASGTNCTNLQTLTSSGSPATTYVGQLTYGSSSITWTPTAKQRGTYKFTISASDGTVSTASQNLTVSVRESSTSANLASYVDALFANSVSGLSSSIGAGAYTSSDSGSNAWLNLVSSGNNGSLTFGSSTPWGGTGESSVSNVAPYRLSLNGSSDSINLGTIASSSTRFAHSLWAKATSPSSTGRSIASSSNGVSLTQSTLLPGRIELTSNPTTTYYTYKQLVYSDKPVGYWRLDETSGATATDSTSQASNGTYTGGYTLDQTGVLVDEVSKAVSFNGSTGYIALANPVFLQITGKITLEAWINIDQLPAVGSWGNIIGKGYDGTNEGYFLRINRETDPPLLEVGSWPSGGYATYNISSWTTGTWYHVAGVYDGTNWVLYANGVQVGSGSGTGPATSTRSVFIGAADLQGTMGRFFQGKIDEPAVYSTALTATQVMNHYQTGIAGNYVPYPPNAVLADNPVGYWRFGELSGTVAYDRGPNAMNGTYFAGTTLDQPGLITGDPDRAAGFDGSSGCVRIGNQAALPEAGRFSIELWLKMGAVDTAQRNPISKYKTSNTQSLTILKNQLNQLDFITGNGTQNSITYANVLADTIYHVVAIWDGNRKRFYINGTQVGSSIPIATSRPTSGANDLTIGCRNDGTRRWLGTLDDVAIYDYALSADQVVYHYNNKNGRAFTSCVSASKLSSDWGLIQTLWDGTNLSLFMNGRMECKYTPAIAPTGGIGTQVIGADSSESSGFWQGLISSFKAFATSDGTAPASLSTFKADFAAEGNRFRKIPVENIVTNGLVMHLDPANADQGLRPYASGCSSTDLFWHDVATGTSVSLYSGFSSCSTTKGWQGSGIVSSPYRLVFDGSSTYVLGGNTSHLPTGNTARSVSMWFNTADVSLANQTLIHWGSGAANMSFGVALGNSSGTTSLTALGGSNDYLVNTPLSSGQWTHVGVTFDGTTVNLYKNGVSLGSASRADWNTATLTSVYLGVNSSLANYFSGSLGNVQIYNRQLGAEEIKQNCLVQESRYTGTPLSICAAP